MFWKNKQREKAIRALKDQLGIDVYESGRYLDEKQNEYQVSISDKDDCIAVVNRKEKGRFIAKEWFVYSKSNGWIKKACSVFSYLQEKKKENVVSALLRMSRLPLKTPKTFANFDFAQIHGK